MAADLACAQLKLGRCIRLVPVVEGRTPELPRILPNGTACEGNRFDIYVGRSIGETSFLNERKNRSSTPYGRKEWLLEFVACKASILWMGLGVAEVIVAKLRGNL